MAARDNRGRPRERKGENCESARGRYLGRGVGGEPPKKEQRENQPNCESFSLMATLDIEFERTAPFNQRHVRHHLKAFLSDFFPSQHSATAVMG